MVWNGGSTVNVYIDGNFGTSGQDRIAAQLGKWNSLGVNFQIKANAADMGPGIPGGGNATWFIFKDVPPQSGAGSQGETSGYTYNGRRGDTITYINPGVSDPTALTHVASHEVGHTFGLADCTSCAPDSSAMTVPASLNLNALGGHDGPTQCDACAVLKNYVGQSTTSCAPSPTPTPTLEPTPTPDNPNDCQNYGGFWNFTNNTCNQEPVYCAEHCIPYWPLDSGGCSSAVDYCSVPYGCPSGTVDGGAGCCCFPTPVLVDVMGDDFALTDPYTGVNFDFGGDGHLEPVAWTRASSDDAWLGLDRNGNGRIDNGKELFGNFTDQPHANSAPNGFAALAEFDRSDNGGNTDGMIDRQDAVFNSLLLWQDTNHNGISETSELHTLSDLGLKTIELDYKESKRTDQYGNQFRYRAKIKDTQDAQLGRWAWDVILLANPAPR